MPGIALLPRWRSPLLRTVGLTVLALSAVPIPGAAIQDPALEAVETQAAYTADVLANVRGGVETGVVGLGNLDVTARIDAERLLGWEGTTLFVYGLATHGAEPTSLAGDAQVASNIEAPDGVRLYEAWAQKNFAGPNLSLLVGLYDVNSEFDVADASQVFLNSSFGIGAEFGGSGLNGPSIFPVTSLGARLQWHPTHQLYLQGAVLDGVPGDPGDPGSTAVHLAGGDGALWVAEAGWLQHAEPAATRGEPQTGRDHVHDGIPWRVALGAWQYTRSAERLDGPGRVRGRPGVYVLAEARPLADGEGPGRRLGLFLRQGFADGRANRFDAYTGAGVSWRGPLGAGPDDVLGLGIAIAHNGGAYRRAVRRSGGRADARETTLELTYRASLGAHLMVQPDLQWILNPDTDPGLGHALLAGVRAGLSF